MVVPRHAAGMHSFADVFRQHAKNIPDAPAVADVEGTWTYAQLWEKAGRIAALLAMRGLKASEGTRPRPLAVLLSQGREWYAICLAAWRLGIPVVALSRDLPKGEAAERDRAAQVAKLLQPLAFLTDGHADSVPGLPLDCVMPSMDDVRNAMTGSVLVDECQALVSAEMTVTPDTLLCYVFTGGTTRHSKCVACSHAMALWEVANYSTALPPCSGARDRFLQYTSTYWGASVFGHMDLVLAFGGCNVMVRARQPEEIAVACERHKITVLGIVPSQIRAAWPAGPVSKPSSLRVLIFWAERLPLQLAREWATHAYVFDMLIASEYWLALHSDCSIWRDPVDGAERHVLHPLPDLDFRLVREDGKEAEEGEPGVLYLSGPTVFSGYVGLDAATTSECFVGFDGKRYYYTKDRLKRVPKRHGGGLVYLGRSDSLVKRGGAWQDLEAAEAAATAIPGVAGAAVVAADGPSEAFLVLENPRDVSGLPRVGEPLSHLVEQAVRALGSTGSGGAALKTRIWSTLPVNSATSKVNRRELMQNILGQKAREVAWQARLQSAQRTMFWTYAAWHILALTFTVSVSFLRGASGIHRLADVLSRLNLLPYLWAVMLHTLRSRNTQKKFDRLWFGMPDSLVLIVNVIPGIGFIYPLTLFLAAALIWLRDHNMAAALGFLLLAVFATVADAATSFVLVGGYLVFIPSQMRFFASLPVAFMFAFPKWIRDEFKWRSEDERAVFRRWLSRLLPCLIGPSFDAAIVFKEEEAEVDWGDEDRWPVVNQSTGSNGMADTIDFWRDLCPAIKPMPAPSEILHVASTNAPSSENLAGNSSGAPVHIETSAAASHGEPSDQLAKVLASLVERVGGRPPALSSLDSLQAIRLAELARRELGIQVSAGQVLRSANTRELAEVLLNSANQSNQACQVECADRKPDADGAYRVYLMAFPKSPVDWYVRYGGLDHLDLAALQRAVDKLVSRHSALQTVETPDEPMREAMDRAAALWQVTCSAWGNHTRLWSAACQTVGNCLFECWPRTVLRDAADARVQVLLPENMAASARDSSWDSYSDDDYMLWIAGDLRRKHRWPFHIFAVPLLRSPKLEDADGNLACDTVHSLDPSEVIWYIYAGITHAYSDGACGQALLSDLLRLYGEEAGLLPIPATEPSRPAEHFALLQQRLLGSLRGRLPGYEPNPNGDVYHEIACEDWGKRCGFQKRIILAPKVQHALSCAATDVLGCGSDVAWLTAILGTLFRLFPSEPRIQLILKCACRDGPGEAEMVGFLSEQRVFPVDVGDTRRSTLLDVACAVDSARRSRAWRAPLPYEASMSVYVNIVASVLDGLPFGCRQVTGTTAIPQKPCIDAYNHLNIRLDQRSSTEWDFRIFYWDAAWGWNWGTYFAATLGSVIADMVECPLEPLVPVPRPHWRLDVPGPPGSSESAGAKRKEHPSPSGSSVGADPNPEPPSFAQSAAALPISSPIRSRSGTASPPKVMRTLSSDAGNQSVP